MYPNPNVWFMMLVTSCLLRNILLSSFPTFEGSRRWLRSFFFPVFVVSAFNCLHAGGINLYLVALTPHHPNIPKGVLLSKLNGATVVTTVAAVAAIECYFITTIVIFYSYAAEGVL